MSAFLGDRESQMPAAARKKSRKDPGKVVSPDSNVVSMPLKRPLDKAGAHAGEPAHKRQQAESSSSSDEDSDDDDDEEEDEEEQVPAAVMAVAAPVQSDWSHEDVVTMLERMATVLPEHDTGKYCTTVERINWASVAFKAYSATECRSRWDKVAKEVRKYRTLTELVTDARFVNSRTRPVKTPSGSKAAKPERHPELPKKPLSAIFRYFNEKRPEFTKAHPDMKVTELSKIMSAAYKELPESTKQEYVDAATKEMEKYKIRFAQFKLNHPEVNTSVSRTKHISPDAAQASEGLPCVSGLGPESLESPPLDRMPAHRPNGAAPKQPTATSAMHIYVRECVAEVERKGLPKDNKKYMEDYASMADAGKIPYIFKAMQAKEQYDVKMAEFCRQNPEAEPKIAKTFLTQKEIKIKDRHDGKPERPPPNGYGLFTMYLLPKLQEFPNNERMGEVSRRWKALSNEERESFNQEVEEKNLAYKKEYAAYLEKLPPVDRARVIADDAPKQKSNAHKENVPVKKAQQTVNRQQQPVSALFCYIEERRDYYFQQFEGIANQDVTRLLAKKFSSEPEEVKEKYKKMAADHKEKIAVDWAQGDADVSLSKPIKAPTSGKVPAQKKRTFPGEPRKPPSSGYSLFSAEELSKLKDVATQSRMTVLSQRWKGMTEEQREGYKQRRNAMVAQYALDVEAFKQRLSQKDLEDWEQSLVRKKPPASKKKAPQKPAKPVIKEESESEEDEASDSEQKALVKNGQIKSAAAAESSDSGESTDDSDSDDDDSDDSDSE